MDRKKVKEELLKFNDNRPFISLSEISKAMHVGKDGARTIVTGLSYFTLGKRKDFLVEDVAKRIAEEAKQMTGDHERKIRNLEDLEKRIGNDALDVERDGEIDC